MKIKKILKEIKDTVTGETQIQFLGKKIKKNYIKDAVVSFSQTGEDLIIDFIFKTRGIQKPSYIDIGANHPFLFNNTSLFYLKGGRGINIEPNPQLITLFNYQRPLDINLNIGIGSTMEDLDFYIMEPSVFSSFNKNEVDNFIKNGYTIKEKIRVKVFPINHILDKHFNGKFPDFLTIDVEGFEMEILQNIDYSKAFPKVICVETSEFSLKGIGEKRQDLIDFIKSNGYHLYADTYLNSIFIHEEFLNTNN
jgi:FkbM family methyltransferase